MEHSGGKQRI